ncbi:hypothetical protein E4U17_007813 [Claviceps sp. LM77 group G4]|nr:hypothetical protein E4U17_007813 [Claviceps sp. LM77 group G4]KAG6086803.1 hypothetical protein E4U33_000045 [Claviceps sp. LM78 group G4]
MSKSSPELQLCENSRIWFGSMFKSIEKEVNDVSTRVCDEFMKLCVKSEVRLEAKSQEADALKLELLSLKKKLQQEIENSKLREVILGNTVKHKISDEEIKQRFVDLRQQMQAIANNPKIDKSRSFDCCVADNAFEFNFKQQYNLFSPADRVFLIRGGIYEIVRYFILNRNIFGLAGSFSPLRCNPETELDRALGDFEDHLRAKKGAVCTETLNPAPRDISEARDEIWHLLRPLLKPGQETSDFMAEICQFCANAFTLRLLSRQSEDQYEIETPEPGGEHDPSKGSVEVCGVRGGGDITNIISFSICGALLKYTKNENNEASCVLEPAHVVVRAK